MKMTPNRERYFCVIIMIAALCLFTIGQYFTVQSIKDNIDDNFAIRAAEHLEQEENQATMIGNQHVLFDENVIIISKIDELEKRIDALNGTINGS